MLTAKIGTHDELYGVYYTVFGSLAGGDRLTKDYFWNGPYSEMQAAAAKAEELKISHQNDESFVVKRYKQSN